MYKQSKSARNVCELFTLSRFECDATEKNFFNTLNQLFFAIAEPSLFMKQPSRGGFKTGH